MPELEGTTLGRYRLKQLLGQGGMAVVYLARDETLFRDVAIKIVPQNNLQELARFRREAETIGPLAHDHILPVFDYGEQAPWHYLVMPYINHGTLSDRLKTHGPLSLQDAGILLTQVASALQFAHEHNILHRDIKPSNILLRDDNYAYLADFGIAKDVSQASDLTQTGMIIGTPDYMAPELLEGSASPGSDIYALGIVLYQMLTGKVPFKGSTLLSTLQKHAQEQPMPPSLLNAAIPPAIEQVILTALAKDPRHRFANANTFAQAYQRALQTPALINQPLAKTLPAFDPHAKTVAQTMHAQQPYAQTVAQTRYAQQPSPQAQKNKRSRTGLIALSIVGLLLILIVARLVSAAAHHNTTTITNNNNPPAMTTTSTAIATTNQVTATTTSTSVTCTMRDIALILNSTQVCNAARQNLSYPVKIYTIRNYPDPSFDHLAQTLSTNPRQIVIAIDVETSAQPPKGKEKGNGNDQPQPPQPQLPQPQSHVHVDILGGSSVLLQDSQYHNAENILTQAVNNSDTYTEATIKAIQSLNTNNTN
ncbi:MAG TPA: serine/threonine-protein kinase [Dictyobacter sp.]|jgi:serine/threonine protein kinase|nr:serine/threonine-protein kinase [Dictyobacter sp.]